jgi:tellurium resistance protein TerZ
MAVSLAKGQKISLEKEAGGGLSAVFMGLGWDVAKASGGMLSSFFGGGGGDSIDLDASCVLFDDTGKLVDVVWFRQLKSKDGSIVHTGDNLTGDGDGDDEVIKVDLSRVPANVKSLVFTVNSFTGQTFDKVANAFCRLVNQQNKQEVARLNLTECKGGHTAVIMAKIYRHNGEWKMHAIGENASGRTINDLIPVIQPLL